MPPHLVLWISLRLLQTEPAFRSSRTRNGRPRNSRLAIPCCTQTGLTL
ncbi:MAG TPA: hypothetical protein PLN97_08390 [Verrucomicrobiota bacterium]|jgi:hypothetical protein|nr:hypothetical protein [Verrucomicrobiota bacterium]OQC26209.1 MAG: hypothetical protein BWX68_00940 [Verrucomicrobia bacterium ADurb.Bin063]HNZ75104.1 hypothetical protein [Verrucomicrobiota bacterium]HOC50041.1 hypothetical protein [Verrucomicrobiota bacterium]HOF71332.1 hypothetical protein [Verrucomicrobiota bacterium]